MTVIHEQRADIRRETAQAYRRQTLSLGVSAFLAAVFHMLSSSLSRTVCDDSGWTHCVSVRAAPSSVVLVAIVAVALVSVSIARSRANTTRAFELVLNRGKLALIILVVAVAVLTWTLVWTYNSHWAPYSSGAFPFAWPLNLELDVDP